MVNQIKNFSFTVVILLLTVFSFSIKANAADSDSAECHYEDKYVGPYELVLTIEANSDIPTAKFTDDSQNIGREFYPALTRVDFTNAGVFGCPRNVYFFIDGFVSVQITDDESKYSTFLEAKSKVTSNGVTTNPSENNENSQTNNNIVVSPGESINCEDFEYTENGKTYNMITELFQIMTIFGPILAIVFGIIDFAKATLASDENALKKAGTNFGKRMIAATLLFILPLIINVILGIAKDAGVFGDLDQPSTCVETE